MHTSSLRTTPWVRNAGLSIDFFGAGRRRAGHVERTDDVVSKYERERGALSPRMRDTKLLRRFGTVRFVYRSGMVHAAKRKRNGAKEGGRSKENGTVSRSKCMRTRGDNTNARPAPLFLSSSSAPFRSRRLSLLLFFIFSPIRINVLMRSRAETRG